MNFTLALIPCLNSRCLSSPWRIWPGGCQGSKLPCLKWIWFSAHVPSSPRQASSSSAACLLPPFTAVSPGSLARSRAEILAGVLFSSSPAPYPTDGFIVPGICHFLSSLTFLHSKISLSVPQPSISLLPICFLQVASGIIFLKHGWDHGTALL